ETPAPGPDTDTAGPHPMAVPDAGSPAGAHPGTGSGHRAHRRLRAATGERGHREQPGEPALGRLRRLMREPSSPPPRGLTSARLSRGHQEEQAPEAHETQE